MKSRVNIMPLGLSAEVENGTGLLTLLRELGIGLDAPCGGSGKCGMCTVSINGEKRRACRSVIEGNAEIVLPDEFLPDILSTETKYIKSDQRCLAVDIGTTTLVCELISGGVSRGTVTALNPQRSFGADVVSRLRCFCPEQTRLIREKLGSMISSLCDPADIELISVAANPAMQQIFLGLPVDNLIKLPFAPLLTKAEYIPASSVIPELKNARLLVIPQPAAYVGADTLSCVMASRMYKAEKPVLLMDIGTNAELVLGCREKLLCTSTAAGPAFEGADISCGMRAEAGAIDRVSIQGGRVTAHIIGGCTARGICGSGLIDAVAAFLGSGRLDRRGRILPKTEERLSVCGEVYLTQEDIRSVQAAKAAVCGGLLTLIEEYGISLREIERVYIAGAFGSYLDISSACRIGLLPEELGEKAISIGNAAQRGAAELALDSELFALCETVSQKMQALELGGSALFKRLFAENMYFKE